MTPQPQLLTIANDLAELPRLMDAAEAFCRELDAGPCDLAAIQLAVEEIATNVMTHGYSDGGRHFFTVALEAPEPDRIRAVVTDDAPPYNPLARPEVDTSLPLEERPIGGLGVHLVKRMMSVCIYEHKEGRNIFTVERHLSHGPHTPASACIAATRFESSAVLTLTGRLDGLSGPELERQVGALIHSGIRTLVFDLAPLEYVSSAGLRVFMIAAKTMTQAGGTVRFAALRPEVLDVFAVAGLLNTLDVTSAVEPAGRHPGSDAAPRP